MKKTISLLFLLLLVKTSCFEVSIKGSGKDIFYPALTIGALCYINQPFFKTTEMAYNLSTLLNAPIEDTISFCSLSLKGAILTQMFPEDFTYAFLSTGTYVIAEKMYYIVTKKKNYLRNTRNRSATIFCTIAGSVLLYNTYQSLL